MDGRYCCPKGAVGFPLADGGRVMVGKDPVVIDGLSDAGIKAAQHHLKSGRMVQIGVAPRKDESSVEKMTPDDEPKSKSEKKGRGRGRGKGKGRGKK